MDRDSRGWSAADAETVRPIAWATVQEILLIGTQGDREHLGSATTIAGEATQRYRLSDSMGGERITAAIQSLASASPECAAFLGPVADAFKNVESRFEVVVGERTNRVYSVINTFTGPNLTGHEETLVDEHNAPVEIKAPDDARILPEPTTAGAPCPTS